MEERMDEGRMKDGRMDVKMHGCMEKYQEE